MTEKKMQLVDWLDDLCVRFIINLPKEELESVQRICFQIEEAQWFYEDFIRPLDSDLPSLNLRDFCLLMFQHCPMFSAYSPYLHAQAFQEFLAYKTRVPVRGAIMLNDKMDQVVLVKGWKKGANWSFPRGKINKDELDLDCAVREVDEETGYDIQGAGLVGNEANTKYIEMSLKQQHMRLYVFRGIPMDTEFAPRTRKEISKVQWWNLADLPTIKNKKQQSEGRGDDLAVNANKFYMVAPFLPQLKKWISGQRRLDKTRRASVPAAGTVDLAEDSAFAEESHANDEAPPNDDLGTLLDRLRISAQAVPTSEFPPSVVEAEDITAQLKSVLGVPAKQVVAQTAANEPAAPELGNNQKAHGLLALLQGKAPASLTQPPHTPAEQVVQHPAAPDTPPKHHQPSHFSALPPPPSFRIEINQDGLNPQDKIIQSQSPQIKPVPTLPHLAQLVSRAPQFRPRRSIQGNLVNGNQSVVAPYQRTEFAQYTRGSGKQPSSVPPANHLPPPKLNAQSSALLNLFKSGPPSKAPENGFVETSETPPSQAAAAVAPVKTELMPETLQQSENDARVVVPGKSQPASMPALAFIPPQLLPRTQTVKGNGPNKATSDHHDKLLSLFRSPSVTAAEQVKPSGASLQLPSTPIELSAGPPTPGHSRDQSKENPASQEQTPLERKGSIRSQKHHQPDNARLNNPPVSATVNGPLNNPQFDMLNKIPKEAKQAVHGNDTTRPPKLLPTTILSRPQVSHMSSSESMVRPVAGQVQTEVTQSPKPQKIVATKLQNLIIPSRQPPPRPDLKGQTAPPKPFHSQILRRSSKVDNNYGEPSPIQPLPSPRHKTLTDRLSAQPTDQKKSLLSLFSNTSPGISPPTLSTPSARDKSIDTASLVSPLIEHPTPKEQADAAFARLSSSIGRISQNQDKVSPLITNATTSRVGSATSVNAVVGEATQGRRRSSGMGRSSVASKKTTPLDKQFLLGYLEGVANSGR